MFSDFGKKRGVFRKIGKVLKSKTFKKVAIGVGAATAIYFTAGAAAPMLKGLVSKGVSPETLLKAKSIIKTSRPMAKALLTKEGASSSEADQALVELDKAVIPSDNLISGIPNWVLMLSGVSLVGLVILKK